MSLFTPSRKLSRKEQDTGLRFMKWHAISAFGAAGLISGGLLAAFALALGASNFQIGILAAIPLAMQPLQILAVLVIERLRVRKIITIGAYFISYSMWVPIALLPFFLEIPHAGTVSLLLVLVAIRGAAAAFSNPSWNSWVRDLVPEKIMATVFSDRMRRAFFAAAAVGLAAAFFIDYWKKVAPPENIIFGYSYAMLVAGVVLGLLAIGFLFKIPEPSMVKPEGPRPQIKSLLARPFRDRDFRQLMKFLFFWNFATYLAIPFFVVYMLSRLGLPLSFVVGMMVLSQLCTVLFLRLWEPLINQYGTKVVLSLAASLHLLVILGWVFTSMPEKYFLTIPLLVVLHVFTGAAIAGINLASMTLRMKMAPQRHATSYLTGASLMANLGAGISPLLGGYFADFFSVRQLEIGFSWIDPTRMIAFPAFSLTGFDFLFVVAFVLGLLALNMLASVREEGEVDREVVLNQLASSSPGLPQGTHFPYRSFRHVPGLDVAIGVGAYQVATSTRNALKAAIQGGTTARNIAIKVGNIIPQIVQESLAKGKKNKRSTLRGIGYGAVQGVEEAGGDIVEAINKALEEAKKSAKKMGISPEEANAEVAKGAMEAAETLSSESATKLKEALLKKVLVKEKSQVGKYE
tara:strand:- start:3121 stop:5016 length:1896 start_codon:yes stop_codon:yes gene_type:complete